MKLYVPALMAMVASGVAAQELAAMPWPTAPAVLRKRAPNCADDTCQQAVESVNFCSCIRQGIQDCQAYFVTTISATTSVVYSTTYTPYTSYTTASDTVTTTIGVTTTATSDVTSTTSTSTTATSAIASATPIRKRDVSKRNKHKIKRANGPPVMPYYAQVACNNDEAAYQSACSCVGVEPSTVYASTVVSTSVVVSVTITPTVTETTVVATDSSTQTVDTETVTTTVSTETAVATNTVDGPFWIQIAQQTNLDGTGESIVGDYVEQGYFDSTQAQNAMHFYLPQNDPADQRAQFVVDDDGYLRPISISRGPGVDLFLSYAESTDNDDVPLNYGVTQQAAADASQLRLRINIVNAGSYNRIDVVSSNNYEFRSCNSEAALAPIGAADDATCVTVTLAAVPVEYNCNCT